MQSTIARHDLAETRRIRRALSSASKAKLLLGGRSPFATCGGLRVGILIGCPKKKAVGGGGPDRLCGGEMQTAESLLRNVPPAKSGVGASVTVPRHSAGLLSPKMCTRDASAWSNPM
jgi:hypothetical protein